MNTNTTTTTRADSLRPGASVAFPGRRRATVIEVRRGVEGDLVSVLVTFRDGVDTVFGTLTGVGPVADECWIDPDITFNVEY